MGFESRDRKSRIDTNKIEDDQSVSRQPIYTTRHRSGRPEDAGEIVAEM
jgi:hypothetical protein